METIDRDKSVTSSLILALICFNGKESTCWKAQSERKSVLREIQSSIAKFILKMLVAMLIYWLAYFCIQWPRTNIGTTDWESQYEVRTPDLHSCSGPAFQKVLKPMKGDDSQATSIFKRRGQQRLPLFFMKIKHFWWEALSSSLFWSQKISRC